MNKKRAVRLTHMGNEIKVFDSVLEACKWSKENGICHFDWVHKSLAQNIPTKAGRKYTTGGYLFSFVDGLPAPFSSKFSIPIESEVVTASSVEIINPAWANRKMKFGVELEVTTNLRSSQLVDAINNVGVPVKSDRYSSCPAGKTWEVQPDGSIQGWEVVSPPINDFKALEKVTSALKGIGCKGTKKTGLHVHHDISDLDGNQLLSFFALFGRYQKGLSLLLKKDRWTTRYCEPITNRGMIENEILQLEDSRLNLTKLQSLFGQKYRSITLNKYMKYGTVEFRGHHGSVDFKEIKLWVEVTHRMIEFAIAHKVEPKLVKNNANRKEILIELLEMLEMTHVLPEALRRAKKYWSVA